MKYQIYLNKDVSNIINKIAEFEGKKPSTLIKQLLEENFTTALKQAERLKKWPSNKRKKTSKE